jgi:glucose/arabinose dehydrogenase
MAAADAAAGRKPSLAYDAVVRSASRAFTALLVVVAVVAAGCGTASSLPPGSSAAPSIASATASAAPAPGASSAGPGGSGGAPRFDPAHVTVDVRPVIAIPGNPLGVVHAGDGSGRLFVVDKGGAIWIVSDGKRAEAAFLDIGSKVSRGSEQGLLGLAFHPGYPGDPRFYTDYTDVKGNTVVSEWRVSGDPNRADPGSERVLLRVDQPYPNHNGGDAVFGPDGYLYITLGDGGSGGDPHRNGQKLTTLLGKILRIDVDHPSDGRPYGIPADNPFLDEAGARPEIYVTGVRNPWRIAFDRATGDLWIGDVGQNAFEEIDVVRAGSGGGQNFGWNPMEGFHCFPSGKSCAIDGLTPPVTEYGHGLGCSVTGGVVYRGTAHPALVGAYLFSDYCSGTIWAIDAATNEVRTPPIVAESHRSISSFGADEAGEVYVTDLAGELLQVTAQPR